MEPYSMDLRERVLAACDAGQRTSEVAATFRVCPAWVRRLKQRRRELGRVAPLPRNAGRPPALGPAGRERLAGLVAARPDATLAELRAGLGAAVSTGALWGTLRAMGLTLKKSRPGPPSRTGPT
jgi:transposase